MLRFHLFINVTYTTCFDLFPVIVLTKFKNMAAPYLKRLVAGFPLRRPGFEPGSVQAGFVVDKVALGQVQ
jgi:hypothetical protein